MANSSNVSDRHESSLVSSNIKSAAYENGALEIEFRNGSRYRYEGVERKVYDELRQADSAGKYFATNIRGLYKHSRI